MFVPPILLAHILDTRQHTQSMNQGCYEFGLLSPECCGDHCKQSVRSHRYTGSQSDDDTYCQIYDQFCQDRQDAKCLKHEANCVVHCQ